MIIYAYDVLIYKSSIPLRYRAGCYFIWSRRVPLQTLAGVHRFVSLDVDITLYHDKDITLYHDNHNINMILAPENNGTPKENTEPPKNKKSYIPHHSTRFMSFHGQSEKRPRKCSQTQQWSIRP